MIELDNRGNLPTYDLESILLIEKKFAEEMGKSIGQAAYIFSNRKEYEI